MKLGGEGKGLAVIEGRGARKQHTVGEEKKESHHRQETQ